MATFTPSRLRGKAALITGASRGIGLALAHALAAEGCSLVVTGRNRSALIRAGRELEKHRVTVLIVACDIRDPAAVDSLQQQIRGCFRQLDILINNAGVGQPHQNVDQLNYRIWREVMATNLDGLFLVTHAVLPLMKRGGTIVNNLSIAAKRVFPGSSAYNASKHGALGLTNTLREELRPRGIRVIALMPGATDTAIWKTLWPEAPRRKMMSAETVAMAVVNALKLPPESVAEELLLLPAAGTL
ncbi:MAG TPA: SDR family NAD(P)-dependent oxidoreductase [Terriglobales bacterium]|nr:SDR family NAD(P)-dependent oxidoreductase [Terriglobales bacterium]